MNHCHETGVYDRYSHRQERTYRGAIVNRKGRGVQFRHFNGYLGTTWRQMTVSRAVSRTNEPVLSDVTGGCSHSISPHCGLAVENSRKLGERWIMCNNARYASFLLLTVESAERRKGTGSALKAATPALLRVRIIIRKLQLVVPSFVSILSHGNVPSRRHKAIQRGTKQILGQRVLNNRIEWTGHDVWYIRHGKKLHFKAKER
jgi:hypothetical protein